MLIENDNQLISVDQLPVISNQLERLKPEIQKMVDDALALEISEETVGTIKKVRAELTKRKNSLEVRRAQIRDAVNGPYEAFMQVYKNCVTDLFKMADDKLGDGVKRVESAAKAKKEEEVKAYFAEYAASVGWPKMAFARAGINVTLTASMKQLKEQARTFIDRIASELGIIAEMEFADEIMVEYNKSLQLKSAIDTVKERIRLIEEEKTRMEEAAKAEAARKESAAKTAEALVNQQREQKQVSEERSYVISAPVAQKAPEKDPNEIVSTSFKVTASRAKIRALREFMEQEEITYGRC